MTIRGVLFDNDGTLLDTYDLILDSFQHTFRTLLGHELPEAEIMGTSGMPLATQFRLFLGEDADIDEALRVYRVYNETIHDETAKLYGGCLEALQALRNAGMKMGVVTSKRHSLAQHGLEVFGIAPYMDFTVGSDDWPEHKPKPGPVLHGCDLMGLSPAECAYVGDSPYDMRAGLDAGCYTVGVLWGMFDREKLEAEGPHAICERFEDLPALLAR